MKLKKKLILMLTMSTFMSLASCGQPASSSTTGAPTSTPTSTPTTSTATTSVPQVAEIDDSKIAQTDYTLKDQITKSTFTNVSYKEYESYQNEALSEVYNQTYNTTALDSTGTKNVLVIPVTFTDYTCSKLNGGCTGVRNDIVRAFFGTEEEVGWESVSSYYYKSSYGQLNIKGKVSQWYEAGMRARDIALYTEYANPTHHILREAVKWYKANNDDIADFDQDGDGYLDAVWMVYSLPQCTSSSTSSVCRVASEVYWAFTYYDYMQDPVPGDPVANVYAWASYEFMYEGGYSKPDAHTYIHETGHVLGLDDYYSYDNGDNRYIAGAVDMMDNNIVDHNAFSKSLLGWVDPKVVTGTETVTLRPFESSGDAVIIPSSSTFHNSVYDEYLILEYYTPTGLNQKDSEKAYQANGLRAFTENGIKIYHVNNSLVEMFYFEYQGDLYNGYETNPTYIYDLIDQGITTESIDFGNGNVVECPGKSVSSTHTSNTPSRSTYELNLLHLLSSSGLEDYRQSKRATNSDLYTLAEGRNSLTEFTFDNGYSMNVSLQVTALTDEGATIQFTAK